MLGKMIIQLVLAVLAIFAPASHHHAWKCEQKHEFLDHGRQFRMEVQCIKVQR